MAYLPIENYGVIGDCHTVALVGVNGSIDWLCFPVFDAPSVFAAILDDEKGGRFQIAPCDEEFTARQLYLPDTNVLLTRFFSPRGLAEITDFMPIEDDKHTTWNHRVIRRVRVVHGTMHFEMRCRPAFDYARARHTVERHDEGVVFRTKKLSLGLASAIPMTVEGPAATSRLQLKAGECAVLV